MSTNIFAAAISIAFGIFQLGEAYSKWPERSKVTIIQWRDPKGKLIRQTYEYQKSNTEQ